MNNPTCRKWNIAIRSKKARHHLRKRKLSVTRREIERIRRWEIKSWKRSGQRGSLEQWKSQTGLNFARNGHTGDLTRSGWGKKGIWARWNYKSALNAHLTLLRKNGSLDYFSVAIVLVFLGDHFQWDSEINIFIKIK